MSLKAYMGRVGHAARKGGLLTATDVAARELWFSLQRNYTNGEIAKRVKWWLPHRDPVVFAREHTATIPAENFTTFLQAEVQNELHLRHEFARFVEPDDVFWDVGANIGLWTVTVGQAAHETVALEPDMRVLPTLVKNVRANNLRVRFTRFGLSDQSAEHEPDINHRWGLQPPTIKVRRADELIAGGTPAPDVMKVDVEGMELAALHGLGDHLADVRHVLVEVHPEFLDVNDSAVRAFLEQTHTVRRVESNRREYHLEGRL